MTTRERIMCALTGKMPDRIPWSPAIDGYYTSGLNVKKNVVESTNDFGGDVMERHVLTYRNETKNIEVFTEEINGTKTVITQTPIGKLRYIETKNAASPNIAFPIEHTIKTVEDIKIYKFVLENTYPVPTYEEFIKEDMYVGERGIATTNSPSTAFHDLIEHEIGLENFYYMLYDYTDELEDLMDVMHELRKKQAQIVAASPAQVVIGYENTSTTTQSPRIFEKYVQPHLNEYADIMHSGGKIFAAHMCGKLHGLTRQIADLNIDGVLDIAPDPTGDVTLNDAYNFWGSEKFISGGIDATVFIGCNPFEIKDYVKAIITKLPKKSGIILGSGDALPLGTPFENLLAVTEAVNEYGMI
jgi:uroporphyrinogen-III decarboxylase